MSSIRNFNDTLLQLYEHYVGEPESVKDVYGYWLFVAGFILGAIAVVLYAVNFGATESYSDAEFFINKIVGIIGSFGLIVGLFGLVLMLPVRRRAIQASVVGLLVAIAGTVSFGVAYPNHWRMVGDSPDYTLQVLGLYTVGIGIIVSVTALIPVVTGRKGKYVSEEGATDNPDILTGDALDGAQFAVFRDENGDWKWHILHLEALAESRESSLTRPDAQEDIEDVKASIGSAGLMELTTSAFRLYETRSGEWEWTLVRDDGSVVARCGETFSSRDGAEESASFLKDRGPVADIIEIDDAAFNFYESRDRWHWQLLDGDRTPLAVSPTGYTSKTDAETSADAFVDQFEDARLLAMEHVAVELLDRHDGWSWRIVDTDDEELARATETYDSRRDAEEAAEALLPGLADAAVTVSGEPTYELYSSGHEWRWRLVGYDEQVVARNPHSADSYEEIEATTDYFANNAEDADVFEIEDALYERYKEDDHWRWRLVTEDRDVVAASTEPHETADDAADAIERMRRQASEADLIEFENSAFQVYEADSGEWRWRLIDQDGNVLADSGEEHTSRGEAAEAMMTLKEQAPDAELLEIDTAAFELFVDENDQWGWRLIDAGGKLVAEDPATHPTRTAAKEAMDRLLDNLESNVRTMENAIFQTHAEDDWHWRFVLPSGAVVAVDDDRHPTRDELLETLPAVREAAATARSHTIGDVAFQLYESGEWQFRLLDRDREMVADSSVSYEDRETGVDAVHDLKAGVTDAPIFTIEDAAIRLGRDDGWYWELVDADRTVLASAVDVEETKDDAAEVVETVRKLAPMAGRVDFDVASFELFADEADSWRWRLLDEEGLSVAAGSEGYESTETAREAIDDLREMIDTASILEIDSVSFELHTTDDGWRWKLVDRYGTPMTESTRAYETRTEAREAMKAVKEHAPEGWITFTE